MILPSDLIVDYGSKRVKFRYRVPAPTSPESTQWLYARVKPYQWFYSHNEYHFTKRKDATWFSLAWE